MGKTTLGGLVKERLYAFIYGAEGTGKTRLGMSLAGPKGEGLGIITAEEGGPTSLLSAGASLDLPIYLLPPAGEDPFPHVKQAITELTRDPKVRIIMLDGCTSISGRAIEFLSSGEGEKALGFPGWQEILANFRQIEGLAEKAVRAGKSFIFTSWEREPDYEDTLGGKVLKSEGGPLLAGQAKTWLPGNVDILARMTSKFVQVKDPNTGKLVKQWQGQLQLHRDGAWKAKSRWALPSPYPADLRKMLADVRGQAPAAPAQPKKIPAPIGGVRK